MDHEDMRDREIEWSLVTEANGTEESTAPRPDWTD